MNYFKLSLFFVFGIAVLFVGYFVYYTQIFPIFADDIILNIPIVKNFTDSHGFEYVSYHERMVNVGGNDDCALFGYMTPFNHTLGKPEVRCGHERYDVYSFP